MRKRSEFDRELNIGKTSPRKKVVRQQSKKAIYAQDKIIKENVIYDFMNSDILIPNKNFTTDSSMKYPP